MKKIKDILRSTIICKINVSPPLYFYLRTTPKSVSDYLNIKEKLHCIFPEYQNHYKYHEIYDSLRLLDKL